jgi:hypothetical protein
MGVLKLRKNQKAKSQSAIIKWDKALKAEQVQAPQRPSCNTASTTEKHSSVQPSNMNQKSRVQSKAGGDHVVIDGLNVIYGYGDYKNPSMLNLLAMLVGLQKANVSFKCYFDSGAFYTLRRTKASHAKAFRQLVSDYPKYFIELPNGQKADEYILDYADRNDVSVISNDRYRDHFGKYAWLKSNPSRRIPFINDSTQVQILPLHVLSPVCVDLKSAVQELRCGLGETLVTVEKSANCKAPAFARPMAMATA